ncbi:MAG: PQQ-binding-like beta-propeller repeat protein [Gaiellaceae bacterium]
MRRLRWIATAALALGLAAPAVAAAAENADWLSYGHDNQLTNAVSSLDLTPTSARRLKRVWVTKLDGAIYASPLSARVGGRQFIFAFTENGSVYAMLASTGRIVWQREFGTVTTLDCGTWGITSTGAIDSVHGVLYVVNADGVLHGLDLTSGLDVPGYPRTIVPRSDYEYVWGGLRIANDRLYVPVASYCDAGPADDFPDGRLFSIPLADPDALTEWQPVAGPGNLGGVWGWGGVSVDPANGTVFTGIGNSHVWSDECSCYVDNGGYGDQIVALPPDLSSVLDADAPSLPTTGDEDFGAAPLLFQPRGCPPLAAMNNKIGSLYIWNRRRLAAGPIVPAIPLSDGINAFVGSPSWYDGRQLLFDAQAVLYGPTGRLGNGVRAFTVDFGCTFHPLWAALVGDGNQATPLVVDDVVFATGGKTGGFLALGALNGARLWKYPTAGSTVAAMITVGGTVFGADTDGWVYAFRPPPPPPRRLPPTPWIRIG